MLNQTDFLPAEVLFYTYAIPKGLYQTTAELKKKKKKSLLTKTFVDKNMYNLTKLKIHYLLKL